MGWREALDWEENVFRLLLRASRRLRPRDRGVPAQTVRFEEVSARLAIVAQALCGESIRLRRARGVGGVRGAEILLPASLDLLPEPSGNREALLVQTVVASGMRRRSRGLRPPPEDTFERALASLRLAQAAAGQMERELPGFREMHERVLTPLRAARTRLDTRRFSRRERRLEDVRRSALAGGRDWDTPELDRLLTGPREGRRRSPAVPIWGDWFEGEPEASPAAASGAEREATEQPTSEFEAPAIDSLRLIDSEDDNAQKNDPPPSAPFERAESLDSYKGPGRDLDGSDELEAHLEALEEVDLGALFRGDETTRSLLRADLDFGIDVGAADREGVARAAIHYDEWDARKRRYRDAWCAVYPAHAREGDPAWAREKLRTHRPLVRQLRRRLEAARAGLRAAPHQLDGEEIDLEAATDARVSFLAGCEQDPRVYRRLEKRRRDFATTVLLDVSMSTDSWVADRRVLDVGREAALVLGQVAHELGDRLQILAFASETRNRCHVWTVRGFGETWPLGMRRLSALQPTGYTRVGPALRHATADLVSQSAERRLLLLVSDCKPTDYDRYEGRYGVADVRKAVEEAEHAGVRAHALAVDSVARDHLPALFGRNGWSALRRPEDLLATLSTVYGRLTAA